MVLKLYIDYMSQPCRAMVMFLRLNNIPFEEKIVSFVKGETRSQEFEKITPMKRVPVIVEDGFKLTESVAILTYFASKPGVADHWCPKDLHKNLRLIEFLSWQHLGVRTKGARVFITQALSPHRNGKPADRDAVKTNSADFEIVLDQMENYFLRDQKYLAGNEISIADLLGICELMQPASVGYDFTKGRPKLAEWAERVKAETQPHFNDTHKEIFEFSAKYKL